MKEKLAKLAAKKTKTLDKGCKRTKKDGGKSSGWDEDVV